MTQPTTIDEPRITRDDIKQKLTAIQDEAMETVEGARSQALRAAAVVGVVVLVGIYLFGRRGAKKRSTIIEIKRV